MKYIDEFRDGAVAAGLARRIADEVDPARRYRIDGTDYDGAWLVQNGLALSPMKAETCMIFDVKAL